MLSKGEKNQTNYTFAKMVESDATKTEEDVNVQEFIADKKDESDLQHFQGCKSFGSEE